MKLNINETVRVKLTDAGRAAHAQNHRDLWRAYVGMKPTYRPPKEDADGYSRWQLWNLMEQFGPHIGLAKAVMFEWGEIEVMNSESDNALTRDEVQIAREALVEFIRTRVNWGVDPYELGCTEVWDVNDYVEKRYARHSPEFRAYKLRTVAARVTLARAAHSKLST